MRCIVKTFRRPPTGRVRDRNGGLPRLSDGVAHASRCPASPQRTLKAENLGKPARRVMISVPWYKTKARAGTPHRLRRGRVRTKDRIIGRRFAPRRPRHGVSQGAAAVAGVGESRVARQNRGAWGDPIDGPRGRAKSVAQRRLKRRTRVSGVGVGVPNVDRTVGNMCTDTPNAVFIFANATKSCCNSFENG